MPKSKNSYFKGLNKDNSKSKYDPSNYYDAKNLKVITHKGLSTGSIENEKGNALAFKIPGIPETTYTHPDLTTTTMPSQTALNIVGWCAVDKYIVVFTSNDSGSGQIWRLEYNEKTNTIKDLFISGNLSVAKHLIFNGNLDFRTTHRIEVEGRYENSAIIRVYWTDFLNPLRTVNILDPDLINSKADLLDKDPNITFSIPQPFKIDSGNLPSGSKVQYCYRLLSEDGTETDMSPVSPLVTLTSGDIDTVTHYSQLRNSGSSTTGKKSVTFKLKNIDTDYSIIQHIAVVYTSLDTPDIYQFGEDAIPSSGEMEVVLTGNETPTFDVAETVYSAVSSGFSLCKTLDSKNNYLIVGNIKKEQSEITSNEWDARAYRFKNVDDDDYPDIISKCTLDDLSNPIDLFKTTTSDPDYDSVPADHDAINAYNLERENRFWYNFHQYKYQKDGKTLGGSGKNVSYKFCYHQVHLDDSVEIVNSKSETQTAPWLRSSRGSWEEASGIINVDGTPHKYEIQNQFNNFASPIIESLFTGYARGEVYRFGIQFYTKKGGVTFVSWIGDIKFPDPISNREITSGAEDFPVADSVDDKLRGRSLGIEFTIDVSAIASKIGGYRIVRMERTEADKTRLGTGVIMLEDRLGDFKNQDKKDRHHTLHGAMNPTSDAHGAFASGSIFAGTNRIEWHGDKIGTNSWHLPDLPGINLGGAEQPHGTILGRRPAYNTGLNGKRGSRSKTILFAPFVQPGMNDFSTGGFRFQRQPDDYIKTIGYYAAFATLYNRGTTNNHGDDTKWDPHRNQMQSWVWKLREYKRPNHGRFNADLSENSVDGCEAFPIKNITYADKGIRVKSGDLGENYYYNISYGRGDKGHANNMPYGIGSDICRMELYGWWSNLHDKTPDENNNTGIYAFEPDDELSHGYFDAAEVMDHYDNKRSVTTSSTVFCKSTDDYKCVKQAFHFKEIAYVREVLKQYGGNTFESRSKSTYMSTGHFQPITGHSNQFITSPEIYGGDVTVHCFAKDYIIPYSVSGQNPDGGLDDPNDYRLGVAVMYPCESRLNLEYHTSSAGNFIANRNRMDTYNYLNESYSHDEFYSQQNNSEKKFVAKDFAVITVEEFPHRLWISKAKIDGELIDNWKKFETANILDVDGSYGPINKVINFQDRLVFYQDHAIGVAAIDETSVALDEAGVEIVLGKGRTLKDFRYMTTTTGTVHQHSVVASTTALYHYDVTIRKLFKLTQGPSSVSDMKGMSSFFAENVDGLIVNTDKTLNKTTSVAPFGNKAVGVHSVFDPRHNRVLFTFLTPKDGVSDFTIGYNEYMDAFESFYSYTPGIYLNTGRRLLSVTTASIDNTDHVYLHDAGDYGSFYGLLADTSITLLVAPDADFPKIFTNIEYNSEISIDDIPLLLPDPPETLSSIEIWNDYQTTGNIPLIVGTNIKRRMRHWRHVIGRDTNSSGNKARIRDYSIYIKLTRTNGGNKRLVLHDVMISYTPARD